jgi:hypothetical protein
VSERGRIKTLSQLPLAVRMGLQSPGLSGQRTAGAESDKQGDGR